MYKTLLGGVVTDEQVAEANKKTRTRKARRRNDDRTKEVTIHKFEESGAMVPILSLYMVTPWRLATNKMEAELLACMDDLDFNDITVHYCVLPDYSVERCRGLLAEVATDVMVGCVMMKYTLMDGTPYFSESVMAFGRKGCFEPLFSYLKKLKQQLLQLYECLDLNCRLIKEDLLIREGFLTKEEAEALKTIAFDNTDLFKFDPQIPSIDRLLSVFAKRKGQKVTLALADGSQVTIEDVPEYVEGFASIESYGLPCELFWQKTEGEVTLEVAYPVDVDALSKEMEYDSVRKRVLRKRDERNFDERISKIRNELERIKKALNKGGKE